MAVIKVQHLSKKYRIYDRPWDKLRELAGLRSDKAASGILGAG